MLTTKSKCVICGRPLRDGGDKLPIGRVCKTKLLRVDLSDAKSFQIDKALDLIVDGGLRRTRFRFERPVFWAVSSDGSTKYLTTSDACACPAGQAGRLCYHRLAVRMLTA